MTLISTTAETLLARYVEHHVLHGEPLDLDQLCANHPELRPAVETLVQCYLDLTASFDENPLSERTGADVRAPLPTFEGFQTIERTGSGGMGEVYKVRDLRLDRIVAAKVIRADRRLAVSSHLDGFLREARALALFSDRRIVQIHEVRPEADPPVLIMEFVEGFELGRIGPSLDLAQRCRVLIEVCGAVHHAHGLGLQHRDLKPSNIMVDAQLRPRILDFGLSAGDPGRGHLAGTPPYMAPEQLDPASPIDARADVYALGVILYELLTGRQPSGSVPRLPVEIEPSVPEPLQAVTLVAMERDPARRYQSALDLAADLRRFLDGRPVVARPSIYADTLAARVRPHVEELREWVRLKLIYPAEAERLREAYRALEAPEDDWIVESRTLSFPQIALYLGAFLLVCGSLFYFVAARWFETVDGVARPFAVLALPFIGLNAAAHLLYRRDHKAVAIAFALGAVALLPLFLLILFDEAGWLTAPPGATSQLFDNGAVSNRQLQVTILIASVWCGWLALATRTAALSTVFAVLLFLFGVATAADFGLRQAIEDARFDRVAMLLLPVVLADAGLGFAAERTGRPWFSRPLYLGGAALFVVLLELLALDGRAFAHLGVSLAPWQSGDVSDPRLLDTIAAMTLNGALFYAAASLLTRYGTDQSAAAARLLFTIAPFALLHPLGYLVRTGEYALRIDWIYAACALVIMVLSERRQRRSFYYAGLLNLGVALILIAQHRDWFERPAWAVSLVVAGLAALAAGFVMDRAARRHARR
jgi:hypothetical protein